MPLSRSRSERGAIFIHVALLLVVLMGFIAFVADYGMLMVARNQAQNTADAAALAGAQSLAFDTDAADRWDRARNVAWTTGAHNRVWGDQPGVVPTSPYSGAPCDGVSAGAGDPNGCIRVDVYRNGANGSNALSTWFGVLFGVSTQGTRAMAVAQTLPASGTDCLKPWLIPDRWNEAQGNPNEFDAPGDTYTRPTMNEDGTLNYGTGWTPDDIGQSILLKPGNPHQAISPSDFYEIEEASLYEEAIYGCEITASIGDVVHALPGNRQGPTKHGVEELLARHGGSATVIIAMFDPAQFAAQDRQSGNFTLEIVNMLAFRIEGIESNGTVYGEIVGSPAEQLTACSTFPCPTSTGLINIIRLVR